MQSFLCPLFNVKISLDSKVIAFHKSNNFSSMASTVLAIKSTSLSLKSGGRSFRR